MLALWTRDEVAVSGDDGASFGAALPAPGAIAAVVIDPAGTLFVLALPGG